MNISDISGQNDSIEYAGTMLDRHDLYDISAPNLLEVINLLIIFKYYNIINSF